MERSYMTEAEAQPLYPEVQHGQRKQYGETARMVLEIMKQ